MEKWLQKNIKWSRLTLWVIVSCAEVFVICIHAVTAFTEKNPFYTQPDTAAIKGMREYVRDHPDDDFDNDGVLNDLELAYGTNSRCIDTDGDGISDYAEIFIAETDPCDADKGLLQRKNDDILRAAALPNKKTIGKQDGAEKKAPIILPEWNRYDLSRYGSNDNRLEDIILVYDQIDNGKTVVTSLFSKEYGEVVSLVYGYTKEGGLLIADINTLIPVGVIRIQNRSAPMMMSDESIVDFTWFDFYGCGFNSLCSDTIHFIKYE